MTLGFNSWTTLGIEYKMAQHFFDQDHIFKPYFASPGVHKNMVLRKVTLF